MMEWKGVMPAITTAFKPDMSVDHDFVSRHCRWLIDNGCRGIVTPGSLGEGATLSHVEKIQLWQTCVSAVEGRAPVVAAVSALSTSEAVTLARSAAAQGCSGLMVLPPYVYRGDWRETRAHVTAVFTATDLPAMLYNNPIAYGTDFLPGQIEELAEGIENFTAVKESSADVRRVTALQSVLGDRLALFMGVDDMIVEGIEAGVTGWIAGLANALPAESVELFNLALKSDRKKAFALYQCFLPLLRMDTAPKFVQLIKLVQQEVGMGTARVRMPRMELIGKELEEAKNTIRKALEQHNVRRTTAADSPGRKGA